MKWYKFGFNRAMDNLSLEIRRDRMTRKQALNELIALGDDAPHEDIEKFSQFVGISKARFFEIAESHRNRDIWSKISGRWEIESFIVDNWNWK